MWALTGNVWSFLHRFALGAAILSGGYIAGTDGMSAFFAISGCHYVCLLLLKQPRGWMCPMQRQAVSALRIQPDSRVEQLISGVTSLRLYSQSIVRAGYGALVRATLADHL
jgi:hypothetical protein